MLQIIGWMGCAFFAIRCLQTLSSNEYRDEDGVVREDAKSLAWAGVVASILFAMWLGIQGGAYEGTLGQVETAEVELSQEEIDCINENAGNTEAVLACRD